MPHAAALPSLVLLLAFLGTAPAADPDPAPLFDGRSFAGWEGDLTDWRIEDGAIVAGRPDVKQPKNLFLCTTREFGDFELRARYRRGNNNGGIQFRSRRVPDSTEVAGYQADARAGIDGFLYDESRRRTFLAQPDEATAKTLNIGEWNSYRIRAEGPRIRLWLNDVLTVDYTEPDAAIPRRGIIGLQLHKDATEIRYKDITIIDLDAVGTDAGHAAFDRSADAALQAMQAKAATLKVRGAAVIAYIPGDRTTGWISRMQAIDAFILNNKTNVLAIAYAKLAEVADTLRPSGGNVRPKYIGENAYKGATIARVPGGWMAAACSGGSGEADLAIAQAGVEVLAQACTKNQEAEKTRN